MNDNQTVERDENYDPLAFDANWGNDKVKDAKKTVKRLFRYVVFNKSSFLFALVGIVVSAVLSLWPILLLGDAVTEIFNGIFAFFMHGVPFSMNNRTIINILIILAIIYAINFTLDYINQILMGNIAHDVGLKMRKQISNKLNRLPLSYFDRNKRGDILSRTANDVDAISNGLADFLPQLLSSTVMVLGALVMMFYINWILTIVALVTLPIVMGLIAVISKKSKKFFDTTRKRLGEVNGHIEESYTGQVAIKAYTVEEKVLEDFEKYNNALYEVEVKSSFFSGLQDPLSRIINGLGYVILAVVGGIFVVNGRLPIGRVQSFIQYSSMFSGMIGSGGYMWIMMQSTLAGSERVFEFLDEEEIVTTGEVPIAEVLGEKVAGKIEFDNVKFGYSDDNILIENITLSLNPGDKIAIVGPTGAGKTTLVNLIMRFYDLQGGCIKLDGVDTKKICVDDLRSHFGMVLQDTWIFNGSVYDNISYARPSATKEEVIEAAKAARIHRYIQTLPKGYDTIIGDESTNISGGQMQLLTIARVFLENPEILILDEATSNIDTSTELEIQKSMKRLMRGRTSFVIAHRLSTIKDSDVILVMDKGSIVEVGSHEELLAKDGFYAGLYNSQFEVA